MAPKRYKHPTGPQRHETGPQGHETVIQRGERQQSPELPSNWVAPTSGPPVPIAVPPPSYIAAEPAQLPQLPPEPAQHQHGPLEPPRPVADVVQVQYKQGRPKDVESGLLPAKSVPSHVEGGSRDIPAHCKKQVAADVRSFVFFAFYLCGLIFYMYVRWGHTLRGLSSGQRAYGVIVLLIEMLGATTVITFGLNHLWRVVEPPTVPCKRPYRIHILIACYKEPADVVAATIEAATSFELPAGCESCTVYLCDDQPRERPGEDPPNLVKKKEACAKYGAVHVFDRKKQIDKGQTKESNAKSFNLNNTLLNVIFRDREPDDDDIIAVFDADMVAEKKFLAETVYLFDTGKDVGMVLTPQYFRDLDLAADVFNYSNFDFWEYMQPGYDALGFISCTGTNFLARAKALKSAGWFPSYTITEDYALGMEMKKEGWVCRYVNQPLARGDVPDGTRASFQQRSRWCKGHFHIMFNKERCPLLQKKLSWGMRILYAVPAWNYVINGICQITFLLIPVLFIWLAVFPLRASTLFAASISVYMLSIALLVYHVNSPYHIRAVWFSGIANTILWYAYFKAFLRTLMFGRFGGFKATNVGKAASWLAFLNSAKTWRHDLYMPAFIVAVNLLSVIFAFVQVGRLPGGVPLASPLAIAICWCCLNIMPYLLLFVWTFAHHWKRGYAVIRFACTSGFALAAILTILATALTWAVDPNDSQNNYCGLFPMKVGGRQLKRPGFLKECVPYTG